MKKYLILLFVMLFTVIPVMGQTDEVRNLSDALLRSFNETVKAQMPRRGSDSIEMTLQDRKYIIEKDIPVGSYRITFLSTEGEPLNNMYSSQGQAYDSFDSSSGTSWSSLFSALDDMMEEISELEIEILGDYGDVLKKAMLKKDASVDLTLSEETLLQISEGIANISFRK